MEIFVHNQPRIDETQTDGVFWSELDVTSFPVKKVYNMEAIKKSVEHILRTSFGERFFNVTFGSDVSSALFELMDEQTASQYKSSIISALSKYEPRIKVNSSGTRFISDKNRGLLFLELSFGLVGETSPNNYTYTFEL